MFKYDVDEDLVGKVFHEGGDRYVVVEELVFLCTYQVREWWCTAGGEVYAAGCHQEVGMGYLDTLDEVWDGPSFDAVRDADVYDCAYYTLWSEMPAGADLVEWGAACHEEARAAREADRASRRS